MGAHLSTLKSRIKPFFIQEYPGRIPPKGHPASDVPRTGHLCRQTAGGFVQRCCHIHIALRPPRPRADAAPHIPTFIAAQVPIVPNRTVVKIRAVAIAPLFIGSGVTAGSGAEGQRRSG